MKYTLTTQSGNNEPKTEEFECVDIQEALKMFSLLASAALTEKENAN
jgi:hypothetical protein